jgi:hypothetical protein
MPRTLLDGASAVLPVAPDQPALLRGEMSPVPRSTMFCRVLLLCLVPACAAGEADEGRPILPSATGVHVDESSSGDASTGPGSSSGGSSTGDAADVSSSSGGEGSTSAALLEETSTGADPGGGSSSGSSSTGDVEAGTSTGGSSTGGDESSSTGEPPPPPAVCGDGVCEASERTACWAWDNGWTDNFCFPDCKQDPACLAEIDCECTPEAAAVKNWCNADPLPACSATAPGGVCSQPGGPARADLAPHDPAVPARRAGAGAVRGSPAWAGARVRLAGRP